MRSISKGRRTGSVSDLHYRRLFETAQDGILILDARTGAVIDANPFLADLVGRERRQLVGRKLWDLDLFADPGAAQAVHGALLRAGYVRHDDLPLKARDGSAVDVEWIGNVYDVGGQPVIQCNIRDISSRKYLQAELQRAATIDDLTGIANRRQFMNTALDELQRSHRYRRPVSLMIIDADHFKQINDTHSHQAGDRALRMLAQALHHLLRNADVFGRLGGEEFAVLMPETELVDALEAAERLRQTVEQLEPLPDAQPPVRLSVSIGVATTVNNNETLHGLLALADAGLYRAKEAGRNRVSALQDAPSQTPPAHAG